MRIDASTNRPQSRRFLSGSRLYAQIATHDHKQIADPSGDCDDLIDVQDLSR